MATPVPNRVDDVPFSLPNGDFPGPDLFSARLFHVALIDVEVLCAGAVIFRFAPAVTRRVCQLLFAGFVVFSVYQADDGAILSPFSCRAR